MDFLNPGLLPGRTRFNETFLRPIQMGTDSSARDALRRITGPFILRRLKTDPDIVSDLPPRVEEKVYCPLTAEQAELYAAEVRDLSKILSASGSARRGNVLGLLTRLKQICNHPEHYFSREAPQEAAGNGDPLASIRSGKVRRLDEMLDDVLAAGECALVFTQYAVMGRLLQRHLRTRLGCDIPFLYGGTKLRDRDTMIARFQQPDGPPVFIVSIKAGGTGLDLTRANHVFHFDRWWNPAVENQATDRAHRIGQTKTVFVHTFICEGTLESRIDDLITGKTELARQIVGSGDSWIAGLSDDTLREVLALSASATAYAGEETE
jgi:non-specific serine/threonine protein kinase